MIISPLSPNVGYRPAPRATGLGVGALGSVSYKKHTGYTKINIATMRWLLIMVF